MSAKYIKLSTGEEIIADLVSETDQEISIKDAVQLGNVSNTQLGFINYPMLADTTKGFVINKKHIIFILPVEPKIEEQYNTSFSKLVVAKPGTVVPNGPVLKLSE